MPFLFILFILTALVAIGLGVYRRVTEKKYKDYDARILATEDIRRSNALEHQQNKITRLHIGFPLGVLGFSLVLLLIASVSFIPARTVGVVTSFGKPVDSLSSGLNFKAPWEKVTKLDGTIQTNSAIGKPGEGPESEDYDIGDVDVRLGNDTIGAVRYTVRWRIVPEKATALYADYRSMENIRESLVTRETIDAVNKVLATYDPLQRVKDDNDSGTADFSRYAEEVKDLIQNSVDGSNIEIRSVSIPLVVLDGPTQKRLNDYQGEIGATRIAEQKEQTNLAQAKANDALSKSISNDPNVLVAQCLTTFEEMVRKGQKIPVGFTCWPGSSVDGILVSGAK